MSAINAGGVVLLVLVIVGGLVLLVYRCYRCYTKYMPKKEQDFSDLRQLDGDLERANAERPAAKYVKQLAA